jgi:DNA-binding transcriptional regulator YdaS (Cro superfamily)
MAVHNWKKRGVPLIRAIQIERLTGGAIKAHDLRPDIFGDSGEDDAA